MAAVLALLPVVHGVPVAPVAHAAELPVSCAESACAGALSQFATSGSASLSRSGTLLRVDQATDRAILNWRSFDVAAGHGVEFRQPDSSAVALNRIHDAAPSRILGTLSANGQVYLLNANGVLFGEGARVDVASLVASSLDVADAVFNGVGIAQAITQGSAPAFTASGSRGPVEVAAGAEIRAATGGRILLAAPEVGNAGSLRADDGQVLLVAVRDRLFLEPSANSELRGFLVGVGNGGTARNSGEILVSRGNATLLGAAVNQDGRIAATTSVQLNGSVRLVAHTRASIQVRNGRPTVQAGATGAVSLGAGSRTEVLPDLADASTVVDDQPQPRSFVEIGGANVDIAAGAQVRAPGGRLSVLASSGINSDVPAGSRAANRLRIGEGAVLDVSGIDSVVLPQSRNLVEVDVRANELADSPLQRDGVLRGDRIVVDARAGASVALVDGAIATVQRSVGERLATGGDILLASGGDVVVAPGARLDVSGGAVRFESGMFDPTQVVSNGRVMGISEVDADARIDGIVRAYEKEHARWGVTETFDGFAGNPAATFASGYVEGKDAGTLTLRARGGAFAGIVDGGTQAGFHQRRPPGDRAGLARPFDELPLGGRLAVDFAFDLAVAPRDVEIRRLPGDLAGSDMPLPDVAFVLAQDVLRSSALASASVNTNGRFSVAADVALDLAPGTRLQVEAANIDWAGDFTSRGGSLSLHSRTLGTTVLANIRLAGTATIDVRGAWVNDNPRLVAAAAGELPGAREPLWIDGGSVVLDARGDLDIQRGSLIDAGGGAWLDADGSLHVGAGGDVSLASGLPGADTLLSLGGAVIGTSIGPGGRFRLEANQIAIVPAPPAVVGGGQPPVRGPGNFFVVPVAPTLDTGFGAYEFVANRYDLLLREGTRVTPVDRRLVLGDGFENVASGTRLADFSLVRELPLHQRGPIDVTLGVLHGDRIGVRPESALRIEPGATVDLHPGSGLELVTDQRMLVGGTLRARGGSIDLHLKAGDGSFRNDQAIWLGAGAVLDASATSIGVPDDAGLLRAQTFAGGRISLRADRGWVMALAGSTLDVSGGLVDLDLYRDSPFVPARTTVPLDAGSVDIQAGEGFVLESTMRAAAPRADARGGRFSALIDAALRDPDGDSTFRVDRDRALLLRERHAATDAVFGGTVTPRHAGAGEVSVATLREAGFDSVELAAPDLASTLTPDSFDSRGMIRVAGDVGLDLRQRLVLDAGQFDLAADATLRLSAAHATLGNSRIGAGRGAAAPGTGALRIDGLGIDLVGHLRVDGAASVDLRAREDIRGIGVQPTDRSRTLAGSLAAAGQVSLTARQVAATTLAEFSLSGRDITVAASGEAPVPVLSAGGALALRADSIRIGGALRAPGGSLDLQATRSIEVADGGLLSVSLDGAEVPFGRTQGGIDWVYPLERGSVLTRLVGAPPEKRVALAAPSVVLAAGSTVDLAGGGDLLASEFIRGPGGTRDGTEPAVAAGSFAVLPSLGADFAPWDRLEYSGFDLLPGQGVELAAAPGLAAGTYALLPPRYALLPGALLVTPIADSLDAVVGAAATRLDGVPLVAGRFVDRAVRADGGATTVGDGRLQAFAVTPGESLLLRSEIRTTSGNSFFPRLAAATDTVVPALPRDGGKFSAVAEQRLDLDGSLLAGAAAVAGALAGVADISAARLQVTAGTGMVLPGFVGLDAAALSGLEVGSLLLGGTRSRSAAAGDGAVFDVAIAASDVRIDEGAVLELPEVVLAARDLITVAPGARLSGGTGGGGATATLPATLPATTLRPGAAGAVLAVSAASDLTVERGAGATGSGDIDVQSRPGAAGAGTLRALLSGRSVAVDAGRDARFEGELAAPAAAGEPARLDGTVSFASRRIAVGGDAAAGLLTLRPDLLAAAGVRALSLRAREALEVATSAGLVLDRFTLNAPLVRGRLGGADDVLRVRADDVLLAGGGSGRAGVPLPGGAGAGTFVLEAGRLRIGEGNVALTGFAGTRLAAGEEVRALGMGGVFTDHALMVTTPLLAGAAGSVLMVDSGMHALAVLGGGNAGTGGTGAGPGARLALAGGSVEVDTRLDAPAGGIDVVARGGDLQVGPAAELRAGGAVVTLGGQRRDVAPGRIDLAAAGHLRLATGARIDVGAAAGSTGVAARGGELLLRAGGEVDVSATLAGAGATLRVDGGSLDAAATGVDELARLDALAAAGAFGEERSYRQRAGDLTFRGAAGTGAATLRLQADQGGIVLAGRTPLGERAELFARDGIDLAAGGLDFTTTGLAVLDARVAAPAAGLRLPEGSVAAAGGLDVGVSYDPGTVGGDLATRLQIATLPDVRRLTLRPTRVHVEVDGVLDAVDQQRLAAEFATLSITGAERAALAAATGVNDADLRVRPELQVASPGTLRVAAHWRLGDLRLAGEPGRLLVRAAGDLRIDADIEDGYSQVFNPLFGADVERLDTTDSFAIGLVAGADLSAVDPFAVLAGAGDLRLGAGVRVRTGTGDVDLRAGRDVLLGSASSAVYSGGRSTGFGNLPDEFVSGQLTGEFGESALDGGAVRIAAGRDYVGARSSQLIGEWLPRFGGPFDGASDGSVRPTASGVVARAFRQGVGAFASGGSVSITAGRDVREPEVALPQTAQHVGDALRLSTDPFNPRTLDNAFVLRGADDLRIRAGRDLTGGFLYQGQGVADVRVGGDIAAGTTGAGLVLAANAATLNVVAGGNLRIEQVFDAGLVPLDDVDLQLPFDQVFHFTYGDDSLLELTSVAGDLVFSNDRVPAFAGRGRSPFVFGTSILPGTVAAWSLAGDIVLERGFTLFPDADGGLTLAAAGQLRTAPGVGSASVVVNVPDADPALLPTRARAAGTTEDAARRLPAGGAGPANLLNAATPLHAGDRTPVRLIADGDANLRALVLNSAEAVEVTTGRDLLVDQLNIQHANADDVSRLDVGRDFRFVTPRDPVTGAIGRGNSRVDVAGGGILQLMARRNIDLGAATGIRSSGDLRNNVLPDSGARLDLIAGFDAFDVAGFVDAYVRDDAGRAALLADQLTVFMRRVTGDGKLDAAAASERFAALPVEAPATGGCSECFKGRQVLQSDLRDIDGSIVEFMRARGADLDADAAREQFLALDAQAQQPLVTELFFDVLAVAGSANALDESQGFDAGYAAIEALFPGTLRAEGNVDGSGVVRREAGTAGGINLFFSRVATNDGGDINMLVPGGSVNVGLSASFAGAKPVSELGIVAQRDGSVRAFVDGDFQINQSRVFALDGGDIVVWATVGNIDAGRGAKSAVAAPPPTVSFDSSGNVVIEFPPAIAGSGIRSAVASEGRSPGDILLFAPAGAIVASDAPIVSAGDVLIAATQVVGTDISAGGATVGVPVGSDGLAAAVAGAGDSASQAAGDAADTAAAAPSADDAPLARAALGWLEVFLEGFDADLPPADEEDEEAARRRSG
jgi:filamentous hemagglutinin family protein